MSEEIRKQRILIVDDAPENIRILAQALKTDYKTTFATAGAQAIKFAMSEEPPDLILLDIMMPEMDGYEVCRRLKAEHKTKNIPVIFITAMNQEEDETKGLDIGAVDYIIKPFSMAIVKARVRTHLELKRHRDILENLSSLDGLTAIPNRRRFDEVLQTEWRHCMRESSPLSLVMIDIDYFKNFNDTRGHQAGDDCLKRVAKALANSVKRPMDIVARYGGEEFAAILPKTDRDGAVFVAETMRDNIESLNISHPNSPVAGYVTISLGSATVLPDNRSDSDILVKAADDALFQAKREGRNSIRGIDLN
ncbi:MAG: diguanylate cyclase response regulator [Desulfobacteraceae bacterium IS3]|nr:MAG: diguanylate cyclase response regulator [Desulfobacteraceae bacterium IS3]